MAAPGKNDYHFQKLEDINNIRFNGSDTGITPLNGGGNGR